MVEKQKKCSDNSGVGEMLLTDLLKALDCLRHDSLIAELATYGFDYPSLCFVCNYLSDRTQSTKVNNAYSSCTNIRYSVPQGSILGTLFFNIDICNLFLWDYKCDITSHADDNIPYTSEIRLNFRWFKENHMIANTDKYHLLVTTNAFTSVNINSFQITNNTEEKLLGITFHSKSSRL